MYKFFYNFFSALLFSLALCTSSFAACLSQSLSDQLVKAIGDSHRLFTAGTHVENTVLNRKVLQFAGGISTGKPESVHSSVHPSIMARIQNGETNLDLMRKGNAPIGPDGKQVNLHHLFGLEPGDMAEVTATDHQINHKVLHDMIEKSFRNDKDKENSYTSFRKAYWKERAKQLGG